MGGLEVGNLLVGLLHALLLLARFEHAEEVFFQAGGRGDAGLGGAGGGGELAGGV